MSPVSPVFHTAVTVKHMLCIQTSSWVLLFVYTLYLITITLVVPFDQTYHPLHLLYCHKAGAVQHPFWTGIFLDNQVH